MSIGYFNGQFIDLNKAVLPIEERGHHFGDGVYELIRCYNGKPFMLKEHIERLFNSAKEIKLKIGQTKKEIEQLIFEGIEISGLLNSDVYLQITRGIAERNHLFPNVPVSISMTVKPWKEMDASLREKGIKTIFHPDERWANCYIKSLNLLPNILAKQTAYEKGCFEAILIRDGYITEGTSSNVFIVKNGKLYTTPLSNQILPGITRMAVKKYAEHLQIPLHEEHFTPEELLDADEVFITSTTAEILPIVECEGKRIGNGKPGDITKALYEEFQRFIEL